MALQNGVKTLYGPPSFVSDIGRLVQKVPGLVR